MAITAIAIAAICHALERRCGTADCAAAPRGAAFFVEARSRRLRGRLDWSEAERRGAVRPADQAKSKGKQPSALAASQRDNEEADSAGRCAPRSQTKTKSKRSEHIWSSL